MDGYFGNTAGGYGRPSAPTWGSRSPAAPPAPSYGGSLGGPTEQLPYAVSAPAYPTYPPQAFPTTYRPAPPGRSTGRKVLLGLAVAAGGFFVLVVIAAVVLPTFLDQGERGLVARTSALGGEMRCGPATEGSTVCVFVDPAAYGAIAVFGGTDPAGTARAIRAAVEHRAA